jgi:polyribonucleotide nucleotidyltransferase
MDFKVAGTKKGITAIQMDIKIHGLTNDIIRGAIARTREAREFILDECMLKAIPAPRETVNEYAPKIVSMQIDPEKIGEVIGQRGKTINTIIEETGVKIDIDDDGNVSVCGTDQAGIDKAVKTIHSIVDPIEVGKIYEGKVVRIMPFGAFVQLSPNKDDMVHISKLARRRVAKVEDVLNIGDVVNVKVLDVDRMGKISLSYKDANPEADAPAESEAPATEAPAADENPTEE